jgi:hypothetical protein
MAYFAPINNIGATKAKPATAKQTRKYKNWAATIWKVVNRNWEIIIIVGALLAALSKVGLFRLPGDLQLGGKNRRVYVPIGSCILISLVLTLILWLISYFRR